MSSMKDRSTDTLPLSPKAYCDSSTNQMRDPLLAEVASPTSPSSHRLLRRSDALGPSAAELLHSKVSPQVYLISYRNSGKDS